MTARARRAWVLAVALVAVAGVAVALGVARGEFAVPLGDVLAAFAGQADPATSFVVVDLRLPRSLTAILVGVALGASGAILQDLARNGLVAPDVIGVTAGASLAAVAVLVLGGATALLAPAALAGAALAAVALYVLAWRDGLQGARLVLVGIALNAMLIAATSYLLTRGDIEEVQRASVWLVGSVYARGWGHVVPLGTAVAILLPLALVLTKSLAALQLGDDVALLLGLRVQRARAALVLVAVALAAGAVAAAGPVAFVAFIAPHLARRAVAGAGPGAILGLAGLVGAALVAGADTATRLLLAPTELPVGLVTTLIAGPYFLVLLHRASRLGAIT